MKKILILMPNMECGGVQVSLLNFIKELQKYKVNITLLFDSATGKWMNRLPQDIHIEEVHYVNEGFHKLIYPHKKVSFIQNIIYHIIVHLIDDVFRQKENRNKRYTFLLKYIKVPDEEFDIAIDYHGYGFITTSVLAQKINAKFKVVFIHDENMECMKETTCDLPYMNEFISVSHSCKRIFDNKFPMYTDKSKFFPNILNIEDIQKKSEFPCEIKRQSHSYILITVGRVMWQKGYDFAVDVAMELKRRKFPFVWYCIGDGLCMDEIKDLIYKKDIQNCFFMLGQKDNPYPFIKSADLYVQTSRHEGYGLAIAEALILNKIVLSTKIECVEEQIIDGYNGFIRPMDVFIFADAIMEICLNKRMCLEIQENIKKIKFSQKHCIGELLDLE